VSDDLLVVSFNSVLLVLLHHLLSNHIIYLAVELSLFVCRVLSYSIVQVIRVIKFDIVNHMLHSYLAASETTQEQVGIVIFSKVVLRDLEFEAALEVLSLGRLVLECKP